MKNAIILVILLAPLCSAQNRMGEYRELLALYQKAVDANDVTTGLKYLESIDKLRPNSLTILKLLSEAYLVTGRTTEAIETLKRAIWINTGIINDNSFVDLATTGSALRRLSDSLSQQKIVSDIVYVLNDSAFHPEGIAFDEARLRFIFGSIRTSVIRVCYKDGTIDDSFFKPNGPMMCIMGMKIDQDRNRLLVSTAAMPENVLFSEETDGWSGVVAFDLDSGRELGRVIGPGRHVFGDLVLDRRGNVYISDSRDPVIYLWNLGKNHLDTLIVLPDAWNLQGIAISEDDHIVFVTDYISGIYRINLRDNLITHIGQNVPGLRGSDGLYLSDHFLIAIQNGVFPRRVLRIKLNDNLEDIVSVQVLDNNLPYRGEPTLGCIINGYLLYLANSPWQAYSDNGQFQTIQAEPVFVRSVKLE